MFPRKALRLYGVLHQRLLKMLIGLKVLMPFNVSILGEVGTFG